MDSYSLGYANIALVKYWGKKSKDPVLPYNPNISLRLDNLLSKTKIEKNDSNVDEFYINDEKQSQKEVDKAKEDLVNALKGLNGKPNVSQDSRNTNNRLPKTSVGSESLLTTFMSLVGGLYVFKKKRKK